MQALQQAYPALIQTSAATQQGGGAAMQQASAAPKASAQPPGSLSQQSSAVLDNHEQLPVVSCSQVGLSVLEVQLLAA